MRGQSAVRLMRKSGVAGEKWTEEGRSRSSTARMCTVFAKLAIDGKGFIYKSSVADVTSCTYRQRGLFEQSAGIQQTPHCLELQVPRVRQRVLKTEINCRLTVRASPLFTTFISAPISSPAQLLRSIRSSTINMSLKGSSNVSSGCSDVPFRENFSGVIRHSASVVR